MKNELFAEQTMVQAEKPRAVPPHEIPYISGPEEISNDKYHNGEEYKDFISSSSLKHYLISPKYAKWARDNKDPKETEALLRGSVYHDLLGSLANFGDFSWFDNHWAVFTPPVNEKTGKAYGYDTKAYNEAHEEAVMQSGGKQLCFKHERDEALTMVQELLEGNRHLSPIIKQFLKNGKAEQSHFLKYQGVGFKYRTDLKTRKAMVDWKTTTLENPKAEQFSRQIDKFGYHISAAFYQFMEHQLTGKWRKFYWVVQEKNPPYDFTILDSSEWTWKINSDGTVEPKAGAMEFIKLMEQHILCEENQQWDGYSLFIQPDWKGYRIGVPEVPGYVKQRDFNFYND